MRWLDAIAGALLPAVIAGCAANPLDLAPPAPDRAWNPRVGAGGEIIPGRAEPTAGASYVLPSNSALAALPPPAALDSGRAYTLPELIDLAQSSHPDTRIAWNNARNAALATGIVQSAYLPQLSAAAAAGAQKSNGRGAPLGIEFDNSASGTVSALSLQWLLFDFGARDAALEASRQQSAISNIEFTAAHQRVIHAVCLAYYADAAARERLAGAAQALNNAREIETAAGERYRQGIGTVIEVAQARQAAAQARLELVQAEAAAKNARLGLAGAIGISPLTPFKTAEISNRPLSPRMGAPVERIVSEALARRPDVLAAYAAQKASAASVRAAEAGFAPKLFLSASGAYGSGGLGVTALPPIGQQLPTLNLTGGRTSSTILFGVSIPIYDGGMRNAALEQARGSQDKAAAALERTRDEAVRQIVAAQSAIDTSLAAHDAALELEQAAQTTFDAALDAYRHGVGTLTAAAAAESQLLAARNARSDAYYNALSAAATLAFATGALGSADAAGAP